MINSGKLSDPLGGSDFSQILVSFIGEISIVNKKDSVYKFWIYSKCKCF